MECERAIARGNRSAGALTRYRLVTGSQTLSEAEAYTIRMLRRIRSMGAPYRHCCLQDQSRLARIDARQNVRSGYERAPHTTCLPTTAILIRRQRRIRLELRLREEWRY